MLSRVTVVVFLCVICAADDPRCSKREPPRWEIRVVRLFTGRQEGTAR